MKLVSLLGHTFELFDLTQREPHAADRVVDRFFRGRRYLGSKDRRFIAEAVYGMIRHMLLLQTLARTVLGKFSYGDASNAQAATLGLYLSYLVALEKKDPDSIVDSLGSYWNLHFPRVPLKQVAEEISHGYRTILEGENFLDRTSIIYSFPRWVVEEWAAALGEAETESLCVALNSPAPLTLRVNTLKTTVEESQLRLAEEGVESTRTKYSPFGLQLDKRVNLPSLASFKEGWFEVQDEASQLVSLLVNPQPGEIIVDACAGGGGKTLELAALMQNQGTILALDVDKSRLMNLQKRADRAGVRNVKTQLVSEDGGIRNFETGEKVDAVLIDAPCSGLGTLRRNPGKKWKVTPQYVEHLVSVQRHLLEQWACRVRVGGRLVYATCTLLRKENEEIVKAFLASHTDFTLLPVGAVLSKWRLADLDSNGYLHLYPHRHGTDGFFAAVMVHC